MKKKKKSQSPKVPGKLLLLGENETFLANKQTVSCQLPLLLPNSLSSISLILAGCSSQLTVSALGRSDQIYLRADTERFPPPQKKTPLCVCVCACVRVRVRVCACTRTGRGAAAAAAAAGSPVRAGSAAVAVHAARSALTSVRLTIGASISVTLAAHCNDNTSDTTQSGIRYK